MQFEDSQFAPPLNASVYIQDYLDGGQVTKAVVLGRTEDDDEEGLEPSLHWSVWIEWYHPDYDAPDEVTCELLVWHDNACETVASSPENVSKFMAWVVKCVPDPWKRNRLFGFNGRFEDLPAYITKIISEGP